MTTKISAEYITVSHWGMFPLQKDSSMTFDELLRLISEMRNAQKQYFKTRSQEWLIRSKELERAIDKKLDDHYNESGV